MPGTPEKALSKVCSLAMIRLKTWTVVFFRNFLSTISKDIKTTGNARNFCESLVKCVFLRVGTFKNMDSFFFGIFSPLRRALMMFFFHIDGAKEGLN